MVEPRQSAMQRIQVGLIGLVVVLLFVSLANMVLDRVAGGASRNEAGMSETSANVPDEPLAELGVTPVGAEGTDPAAEGSSPPSNNVEQRPAGSRR